MTTKPPEEVRVGVVGLGFMGATHIRAYREAAAAGALCRVVAVADSDPARLSGTPVGNGNLDTGVQPDRLFDPALVRAYPSPDELLALPDIDLVSICTPTDSHVDLATAALRAGKHVLVEKPIATRSDEVRRLAGVASELAASGRGRLCIPAMCMRFWPGWAELREHIRASTYGNVVSAVFQRLGSPPAWNPGFYADPARSGGPLFDLHIHDADFVLWCFGPPEQVVSTGSVNHVTTLYRYPPGKGPPHVVAEGGQDHTPGFGFRMRYIVVFERATLDFDLARTPPLLLARDGRCEAVPLSPGAGYFPQARCIVEAIRERGRPDALPATLDDSIAVTAMLETEQASLLTKLPALYHLPK
jgi:predicted dehydrogenase